MAMGMQKAWHAARLGWHYNVRSAERTTERNPSFFSVEKKEAKKSHFGEVIL